MGVAVPQDRVISLAQALLVPVVTAGLGVAVGAFQDWRTRRSQTGRRKLALEDARAQVAFVAEWWKASELLDTSTSSRTEAEARADAWLIDASRRVASTSLPDFLPDRPGAWQRLLLRYPLHSRAAQAARAAFYVAAAWTPIVLGAFAANARLTENQFAKLDLWIAVAAVTVAFSLRALAIALERHASRRAALGGAGYGLFRTALLLHRLEVSSARAARLLMYMALLIIPIYLGYSFRFFLRWPSLVARNVPLTAAAMLALVVTAAGVRAWALDLDRRGSAPLPAPNGPDATQGSPP
ncbi:MAG: hypothetical protein ACKVZ6_15910 [Kineosporiaceae bacterium]